MDRTRSRASSRVALTILLVLVGAASAYGEYPADCPERDNYRYFPRLPLDPRLPVPPVPPWCAEETGRMVALAGEAFQTLERGFLDVAITVSGSAQDFEVGIFDGDTGWVDALGVGHWDAGTTELGYCLFYDSLADPNLPPQPTDEIGMWLGNAAAQATAGAGWAASRDFLPDNDWWDLTVTDLAPGLGVDGNYHFRLVVLFDADPMSPFDPVTVSNFRIRGRATGGEISFGSREFAFEGALHSATDTHTIYPDWDGVFPPAGSTIWNDYVATGRTTYDGTWFFSAELPSLASIELYDGDFDFGNDPPEKRFGVPSGIALPTCNNQSPQDDDDPDSFVYPNLEDPPVSEDFPHFVVLEAPSHPEYPVGIDESKGQEAIVGGGFPNDDSCFDVTRRSPCVRYTVVDPNGVEYLNDNPSSQREWEQFRICSLSAVEPTRCDYLVNEPVLPAGVWSVVIEGMDLSNLNTWHFEVDEANGGCTLTWGYWKNHSEYGPAPYDATWAMLPDGADTAFFGTGLTYYEILQLSSGGGNKYISLAHQYIAAELNVLAGADIPPEVATAWLEAQALLVLYEGSMDIPKRHPDRALAVELAYLLDQYNMGLIGPGHCD